MKKSRILMGTSAVALIMAVFSGILLDTNGEATVPSPIPSEAQPAVTKMLDAIDNYESLSAVIQVQRNKEPSRTTTIDITMTPHVKAHAEMVDETGRMIKQIQNKGKLLTIDHQKNTYAEHAIAGEVESEWKKNPERRWFRKADGSIQFSPRMDPVLVSLSGEANLFPQDFVLGVMHRATSLAVTSREAYLNRVSTVFEGTPIDFHREYYGDSFKVWVDDETGILLKSEFYKGGQLFASEVVTSLKLNETLPQQRFDYPSVQGLKKEN